MCDREKATKGCSRQNIFRTSHPNLFLSISRLSLIRMPGTEQPSKPHVLRRENLSTLVLRTTLEYTTRDDRTRQGKTGKHKTHGAYLRKVSILTLSLRSSTDLVAYASHPGLLHNGRRPSSYPNASSNAQRAHNLRVGWQERKAHHFPAMHAQPQQRSNPERCDA